MQKAQKGQSSISDANAGFMQNNIIMSMARHFFSMKSNLLRVAEL